jgi:cell division protein FtsN
MRFEIRTGGALLILTGLAGLSGAVFALGMVAGYEMARQNQPDPAQLASVYPLPPPPDELPAADAPIAQPPPESPPLPIASVAPRPAAPLAPEADAARPATERVQPETESAAAVSPTATMDATSSSDEAETASEAAPRAIAAATAAPPRAGRGYNIQIGAVMDRIGADEMIAKLRDLGYQPYAVEMQIDGRTWYRVRVGPYASEEEARAAQARLKQEYRAAYTARPAAD